MIKVFTFDAYMKAKLDDSRGDPGKLIQSLARTLEVHKLGNNWLYLLQGLTIDEINKYPLVNANGNEHIYSAVESWTQGIDTATLYSNSEIIKRLEDTIKMCEPFAGLSLNDIYE